MKLYKIAHSRTGDKGNISNISLIATSQENYKIIKEKVTPEKVKEYFSQICFGEVKRYEIDSLLALNFVLDNALGGGVTRSLSVDKHGKSLCCALLEMEI